MTIRGTCLVLVLTLLTSFRAVAAAPADDSFIAGYPAEPHPWAATYPVRVAGRPVSGRRTLQAPDRRPALATLRGHLATLFRRSPAHRRRRGQLRRELCLLPRSDRGRVVGGRSARRRLLDLRSRLAIVRPGQRRLPRRNSADASQPPRRRVPPAHEDQPDSGGGYLFDQDPSSLDPWSAQYGIELTSPWPSRESRWRPIAAVDVQQREENGWSADVSARAGIEIDGVLLTRKLQILLEYFSGHSPNFGLGTHFHF